MTARTSHFASQNQNKILLVQGEFRVESDPEVVISTLLGSCVAACIRDPIAGVGGMNHFLLPGGGSNDSSDSLRYGVNSMELLINGLLRRGARRERLEAKLFGGARMTKGLTDVGAQNALFAEKYLADEGIRHLGGSLRGDHARRIEFWPVSGRTRQQILNRAPEALKVDTKPPVLAPTIDGGVELF